MRVPLIYEGLHEVCPLCGGDSHQLDNYPKLPSQKKIQVVVQKFEDTSVNLQSKETIPSGSTHHPLTENWVMPRKTSSLKPQGPSTVTNTPSNPLTMTAQTEAKASKKDTTHVEHSEIVLANPNAMQNQGEDSSNSDTLLAMKNDEDEGTDAKENVEMYLNLKNIMDVEMSTNSTKRKRNFMSNDLGMVVLLFYNAIITSRLRGILVACISYDGFNVTLMDYSGSYGLDLVSSTKPLALFEGLKLNGFVFVSTNARVRLIMGGCWILPKSISTRVAPTSSE
ncbi:hypothetical protein Cgig2_012460 [Carnegiea gigantea]|uniref:Uncharacterized protein n=1 Tax=Carnegiea gigantea TaxID=171969 RepID=A0A9Q1QKG1_9CARY|nr:hypothetical protein Cgig2_012460 [Carnegiea gigantea]